MDISPSLWMTEVNITNSWPSDVLHVDCTQSFPTWSLPVFWSMKLTVVLLMSEVYFIPKLPSDITSINQIIFRIFSDWWHPRDGRLVKHGCIKWQFVIGMWFCRISHSQIRIENSQDSFESNGVTDVLYPDTAVQGASGRPLPPDRGTSLGTVCDGTVHGFASWVSNSKHATWPKRFIRWERINSCWWGLTLGNDVIGSGVKNIALWRFHMLYSHCTDRPVQPIASEASAEWQCEMVDGWCMSSIHRCHSVCHTQCMNDARIT